MEENTDVPCAIVIQSRTSTPNSSSCSGCLFPTPLSHSSSRTRASRLDVFSASCLNRLILHLMVRCSAKIYSRMHTLLTRLSGEVGLRSGIVEPCWGIARAGTCNGSHQASFRSGGWLSADHVSIMVMPFELVTSSTKIYLER